MNTKHHFTACAALAVEPGGYVQTAPGVVEHYPTLARVMNGVLPYYVPDCYVPDVPVLPALPGVRLPHRWHRETVQHGAYSAELILYDGDQERFLGDAASCGMG